MNAFDEEINTKMKEEICLLEISISQKFFELSELKKKLKVLKEVQKKFEQTGIIHC